MKTTEQNTNVNEPIWDDWFFNSIDGDCAVVNDVRGFILEAPDEETGRMICAAVNQYHSKKQQSDSIIRELVEALKNIMPILEVERTQSGVSLEIRYMTEYENSKTIIEKANNYLNKQ